MLVNALNKRYATNVEHPIVAPPSSPIVCPISRNYSADHFEREILFDTDNAENSTCNREYVYSLVKYGIKTLVVHNLPRHITVEMLRIVFEKYGPLKDVYIPKNLDISSPFYGTIKGFAIIKFIHSEHSANAFINEYGRLIIDNNIISIEFAKSDRH